MEINLKKTCIHTHTQIHAGDVGLIPGLERSPGEGNSYLLQYSCLENPMNRGAWQATVPRVTKSWTHGETNTFTFKEQIIRCGT